MNARHYSPARHMKTAGPRLVALKGELKDFVAGRSPHVFLILVITLMLAFTVRGLKDDSPTEDEWAHLVRGIGYYQTRDMRMHVQHPPLANMLEGLPSAFDDNPDVTRMKTWQEGYAPGLEYIKHDYEHAKVQLARGRYVATLFLAGLVVYVFYFCLSIFGWPTAAAAACLVAFNPTLMGQARYVTTDMPVATFTAIATGELVRYLRDSKRIVTLGLALAGLVLSKHSGIVLLAIVVLVALLAACLGKGIFSTEASLPKRVLRWLGHFALAGLIVLLGINAMYKFDRTGMSVGEILAAPEPQHWVTSSYRGEMLERRSPLPSLPESLRIPLPYSYLFGLFAVQEQNRGGYPSYFLGEQSRGGRWAYFPVLLVTKNPPALLMLLALAGVIVWRRRKRQPAAIVSTAPAEDPTRAKDADEEVEHDTRGDEDDQDDDEDEDEEDADDDEDEEDDRKDARSARQAPVMHRPGLAAAPSAGPAATPAHASSELSRDVWGVSLATACFLAVATLFLLFLTRSKLNMGVRHGIPVIPLASVVAARAFARAPEILNGNHLRLVQVLAFSGLLSVLLAGPGYLNYYNFLALGQGSWINVVGDDWGQDRKAFVRFAKREGLKPLYYHVQTSTRKLEVDSLGLEYRSLDCRTKPAPGSWVAIHVQYVRRFEATPRCATWMQGLEPVHKFRDNIWVYKIPGPG